MKSPHATKTITIQTLLDSYDLVFFDAYGVLVDAEAALPGAVELVDHMNARGFPYVLVTNDALRDRTLAAARYQELGLNVRGERIVTAADLVGDYVESAKLQSQRVVCWGTAEMAGFLEDQCGCNVVPLSEADSATAFFLCALVGQDSIQATATIISSLIRRAARGLKSSVIVANPDLIYPQGESFGIAIGSMATVIEAAINATVGSGYVQFIQLGKPAAKIFAEAKRRGLSQLNSDKNDADTIVGEVRIAHVGDQMLTDVRGANAFGVDSVLLRRGLGAVDASATFDFKPTFVLMSLSLTD